MTRQENASVPRLEYLRVKNYRALRDLELRDLTPLTVLLGPNGSGKSTVFDVFAFLAESFSFGLRRAWDKRGRFRELRSRGASGPIEFELKYREATDTPLITYHLAIDEDERGPYVAEEGLAWRRGRKDGHPFRFLDFREGKGKVIGGESPEETDPQEDEELSSPETLAVNIMGQFPAKHPRVTALREFIQGWYSAYLSADNTRGISEAGPQERLSERGDNLPNVIQHLREQHPKHLDKILNILSHRVPRLERIEAETTVDGRLVLQIKDVPFERPIMAKFASDGTLKMLAYLIVLYDPSPPHLIGIEEPENQLHPRLLQGLAEECRHATAITQLMVTTHSPFFVNGLQSKELWVLYRDEQGYTHAQRASEMERINDFMRNGAVLGDLWMEGHFDVGDPLVNAGGSKHRRSPKSA